MDYGFSDLLHDTRSAFEVQSQKTRGSAPGNAAFPPPPMMTSRGINLTLPMFLLDGEVELYLAPICALYQKPTARNKEG